MPNNCNWITPTWPAPKNVQALTTLRQGGVSQKPFDGLNLAAHVGDELQHVLANRNLLKEQANLPAEPLWLTQVHGTRVLDVSDLNSKTPPAYHLRPFPLISATAFHPKESEFELGPEADASVSFDHDKVCAVLTADCLPILICDEMGTRVAAIHAGWRGLAAGIIEATVQKLNENPHKLLAWFGPAIGSDAFEVGEDVLTAFKGQGDHSAFRPTSSGKWMADIYYLAKWRLKQLGITRVFGGGFCTFHENERFYSFRRSNPTGRMATLIWLNGT